jgi:hypothetical protein
MVLIIKLSLKFCYFLPRQHSLFGQHILQKGNVIHVSGRRGPWGCETSRLLHFLDNRFTDGSEIVSLTHRPPFTPPEASWHSFLLEAESTPAP